MKYIILKAIFLLTIITVQAEDTYWEKEMVRNYVHNSELQRRWAWSFLACHLKNLNGDEKILDIGCGDGKITADISKFIPQGTVTGIDPSTDMIRWAQKQFAKVEYPNLGFQLGGFIEHKAQGSFDIIFSNCALQHCPDQQQAIQNIASLLKSGGKALILVPAIDNLPFKQARKNIQSLPKWSIYWSNAVPRKFLEIKEYEKIFSEAGFTVKVSKRLTVDPFIDRQELMSFFIGTFTPAVPTDLLEQFYNELFDEYLRLCPEALQENGVIEARFSTIEIEAVKQ